MLRPEDIYGSKNSVIHHRVCDFCSTGDKDTLELLFSLPNAEPIIEDEEHFIRDCPQYEQLRDERSRELKGLLETRDFKELFNEYNIFETSNFVYKLFKDRFGST